VGSHIRYGVPRHIGWLGQESAEETSDRQLESKAEVVVCATPLGEPFAVRII
jgi:hypothetical protein